MDLSEEVFTKTAALVRTFSKFEENFKRIDYYKKVFQEFERTGKLTLNNDEKNKSKRSTRCSPRETNANKLLTIKKEKLSSVSNKENAVGDMLPPAQVPIKKPYRTKVKQEPNKSSQRSCKSPEMFTDSEDRPSDVVLQIIPPPLVDVDDSSDDDYSKANLSETSSASSRSSRATTKKTKIKHSKRSISSDSQNEDCKIHPAKAKRKKSDIVANEVDESSLYEEACSTLPNSNKNIEINDATFVLEKQNKPIMNSTMVLEKFSEPIIQEHAIANETTAISKEGSINIEVDDLMADDESPCIEHTKNVKAVNAYNNSPVKKRVEAFEKMSSQVSDSARITKSKRNILQDNKKSERKIGSTFISQIPTSASKQKLYTPLKSSRDISAKTASALKASQEEVELREARRKEKESEALRKKAAIIQARAEEKKRKREEKLIKAQQAREEAERTKQINLEEQLRKEEEKYQQAIAEKQEKFKKQKLEAEKKRLLASKKALEQKDKHKEDEKNNLKEQSKPMVKNTLPIYMIKKAPKLPTDDCYDSEDPETENKQIRYPSWNKQANLNQALASIYYAGHKIKNTLFCLAPQTPKLTDLFQNIDPRRLKRTSSAVWRKPPRFTILPRSELDVTQAI